MNSDRFKNSGFAKLYLWTTKAKYTMGIFFVAFVMFYLLFGLISDGPAISLDFFTAIQMVFACFFIGIAQQVILPVEKLNRTRCVLWVASGVLITLAFGLGFGWFRHFPRWCFIVFLLIMAAAMMAMILSYYLELHRETKRLNRGLTAFQKQRPKREG
ncbi:hypothetical protein LJC61_03860 [Ruminococcaceae bacterium OttesenSCG-928-A16]|nr:hypothetical protein [Ruminococcaceae bacterium OttesenSCG-928-A16]